MLKFASLLFIGSVVSAASAPLSAQRVNTVADAVAALNASGASGQTAPSPAKLALATTIAARLMPDGTYRRMMSGTMDKLMDSMMGQMTALPLRDLAAVGGVPADKLKTLGPGTLKEMMALLDPAFDERMRRSMKVTMATMTDVMGRFEPRLRGALAEAYATHFSQDQLAELDRFFASPTGSAYAAQSMTIMTDPAVMRTMQGMMPELMAVMPTLGPKVEAATADLPKPKKYEDLTVDERKRFAALVGVDPATLPPPAATAK